MRRRSLAVGTLALASLLAGVVPAQAVSATPGLWYFDKGNVQAAHDAGFAGEGVTIAVIDGQINPDAPGLRDSGVEVVEPSYCFDSAGERLPAVSTDYAAAGHATHVASFIAGTGQSANGETGVKGVAPEARVLHYAAAILSDSTDSAATCPQENGEFNGPNGSGLGRAIEDAVDAGADIISISLSGIVDVNDAIAEALAEDVVIVAGLPNEGGVAELPAAANGVIAVQAFDASGEIQSSSRLEGTDDPAPNRSDDVTVAAPGVDLLAQGSPQSWDDPALTSGTSFATPIVAGFLAVTKSKYPDASGSQLIQTLIHNTGGNVDHEPQWGSDMGYGAVSLTAMLQVDPAKYPDENPIFDAEDPNALPSAEDVRDAAAGAATEAPTAAPDAPQQEMSWTPWLVGGGIIGGLVVIAGIVVAIMLSRSSRRAGGEQGEEHVR